MASLDELTQDVGDWLYRYGPSEQTETQFFVTVIGTGVVLLIIEFLRPYIRVLNERRYDKYKSKLEENKKFVEKLHSLKWPPKNEEDRQLWKGLLRRLRKFLLWIAIFVLVVGAVWLWKEEYIDRSMAERRVVTMEGMRQSIAQFDNQTKRLWQKVTVGLTKDNLCEEESLQRRRVRATISCRERAEILATNDDDEFVREYRICMLDRGWRTQQCECGERDEGCVPLFQQSSDCDLVRWKTDSLYLGTECVGYVPHRYQLISDYLHCNERASEFGAKTQEVAGGIGRPYNNVTELHTHSSLAEFDRLRMTIATFRMCMREKGWDTQDCPEGEVGSENCKEIWFNESVCQKQERKWLNGEVEMHPCLDVRHWVNER